MMIRSADTPAKHSLIVGAGVALMALCLLLVMTPSSAEETNVVQELLRRAQRSAESRGAEQLIGTLQGKASPGDAGESKAAFSDPTPSAPAAASNPIETTTAKAPADVKPVAPSSAPVKIAEPVLATAAVRTQRAIQKTTTAKPLTRHSTAQSADEFYAQKKQWLSRGQKWIGIVRSGL